MVSDSHPQQPQIKAQAASQEGQSALQRLMHAAAQSTGGQRPIKLSEPRAIQAGRDKIGYSPSDSE